MAVVRGLDAVAAVGQVTAVGTVPGVIGDLAGAGVVRLAAARGRGLEVVARAGAGLVPLVARQAVGVQVGLGLAARAGGAARERRAVVAEPERVHRVLRGVSHRRNLPGSSGDPRRTVQRESNGRRRPPRQSQVVAIGNKENATRHRRSKIFQGPRRWRPGSRRTRPGRERCGPVHGSLASLIQVECPKAWAFVWVPPGDSPLTPQPGSIVIPYGVDVR